MHIPTGQHCVTTQITTATGLGHPAQVSFKPLATVRGFLVNNFLALVDIKDFGHIHSYVLIYNAVSACMALHVFTPRVIFCIT